MRKWGTVAVRVWVVILPLALAACQTLIRPHAKDGCGPDGCPPGGELAAHKTPTMHTLAHDLDHLEKHIDWYGSAVAKVPDVWGQARLTTHREQFEEEMVVNLKTFEETLQGALARTDQSYFLQATALSAAAGGAKPGEATLPGIIALPPPPPQPDAAAAAAAKAAAATATDPIAPFFVGPRQFDPTRYATALTNAKGERTSLGLSLEPTLVLAQKKRYLDFLNQIRRENEGDDTADSPGYSLNLIRVPVSLLPGKRTDEGYGAEVTMTLTPVLGEDLLPATYRNLVLNDIRQQAGFPLTQFLNDRDLADRLLTPKAREVIIGLPVLNTIDAVVEQFGDSDFLLRLVLRVYLFRISDEERERIPLLASVLDNEVKAAFIKLLCSAWPEGVSWPFEAHHTPGKPCDAGKESNAKPVPCGIPAAQSKRADTLNPPVPSLAGQSDGPSAAKFYRDATTKAASNDGPRRTPGAGSLILNRYADFNLRLPVPPLSFSPGLGNKTGFPTSQLIDVYGLTNCFQIAYAANLALKDTIVRQGYAHLPDVQGFLQQELAGAYRFLAQPECAHLWEQFCRPELVAEIRTLKLDLLQARRDAFRAEVERITRSNWEIRKDRPYNPPAQYSTTAALAWCVLVDSALLTDRLIRDMREAATSQGKSLPACQHWLPYYLPEPPPEARAAFAEYVRLRWPVRVFALDPYTQDQNLADSLLTRRETQLALSMAFAGGKINARTLTRYARRLEADYETIALNRTQVGFSHGENVFGWRFYPRFQTPDTEGNLTTLVRDQFAGGPNRNALLRQRRLEPGPRECVAVVLMPSFVPYATLDVVSDWFALANPKHKVLDNTQALRLSKTVQAIKARAGCVTDACDYRPGDFDRLVRRAEQLEARLPSQTLSVQVPILNTLGGFEMFSNGTTDLAPELYGWYGAPGVSAEAATTLFLVGDHFSPLHTNVIVGNLKCERRMLSRQVVEVTVPKQMPALTVLKDGRPHVHAHIATPYGVTRELLIPLLGVPKPAAVAAPAGLNVPDGAKLTVRYALKPGPTPVPVAVGVADDLRLAWVDPLGVAPAAGRMHLRFEVAGQTITVPCACGAVATLPDRSNAVVVEKAELNRAAADLFNQPAVRKLALEGGLAAGLKAKVLFTPEQLAPGLVARQVEANNTLTVEFRGVEYCDNELKPGGCPPKIPEVNAVAPPPRVSAP